MPAKHAYKFLDDDANWKRRRHFDMYRDLPFPHVGVTVDLDASAIYHEAAERRLPFMPFFAHALMRGVNAIENYRYRIVDGRPALFDCIDPAFVALDREDELFYFAFADMLDDAGDFIREYRRAEEEAIRERLLFDPRADVAHISSLPWFRFTDLVQPLQLSGHDAVPKFIIGRLKKEGGRVTLPFSINAHHGFVDGLHLARLIEALGGGR